jgi:hypothetical protein
MKKIEVEAEEELEERELPEGWSVLKIGEAGTAQLVNEGQSPELAIS